METIALTISDETLRDGEQQVGLYLDPATKQALAHLIAATGVHQIALMPAVHEMEAQLVKQLAVQGLGLKLAASTMMSQAYIDQSQDCGVSQIILFHAVSDRLMFLRDPELSAHPAYREKTADNVSAADIQAVRQRMLAAVLTHLRYAAERGLKVWFAAEDASRADFGFLVDCVNTFGPYLEQFLLCDTVGALMPEKAYIWIHDLLACTDGTALSVHFHNDRGLALENTIQAVLAGASGISGTFNGIGERSGNAPLEQVLNGLRLRFGWQVEGIDYKALDEVTRYMDQHSFRPNPPYSAQSRWCETGIHLSSMRRDRNSYAPFADGPPEVWFGKFSGASNFQYLFEQQLKRPLSRDRYEQLRVAVKQLAIQEQRSFSVSEILALIEQGLI
ncbi:2-isopropylmalate synthase [Romeria aff. gracilis LEGE 07310]|uniref:2-isopropylmalate synthase n=1 Tax=Vasconcelosia minhoensis LEGE 07310 TaxID=915328 RepID=A0A8J7AA61_9CYAN|nr:2-isopropylmalate synthase [Romeria gracilis]MBE9080312.1 2-isopropylmalate synthase [Romeria aff. gracilis LEGE 07310]